MFHHPTLNVASAIAITAAALIASPASAIYIRDDKPVASYNALADLYPAIGFMLDGGGEACTGTLIAPNMVLTAAHCVDNDSDGILDGPAGNLAFGLGSNVNAGNAVSVTSVAINPHWASSNGEARHDMAILTLSQDITGVDAARLTSQDPTNLLGGAVGYRRGNGNKPDGTLTVDECVKVKEGMVFDVTATDKS